MRGTRVRAIAVGAALTIGLAGCGGSVDAAEPVEVFTWWRTGGSDGAAFDALSDVFAERSPGTAVVAAEAVSGAGLMAKTGLGQDLMVDDAPDAFQIDAGPELADYVEAGQIEDLSELAELSGLAEALRPGILDRVTVDGAVVAVPLGIHRANLVWANSAVLEEAGLDPEASYDSIDEWIAALEAVESAGRTPLTVSEPWTMVQLLEAVLLSELGPAAYEGLWSGETDWRDDDVTTALWRFGKLARLADREHFSSGDDAEELIGQVAAGDAAYVVMGDWAAPAFDADGAEIVSFPVPGTDGVFDLVVEGFAAGSGAANPEGASAWLEAAASPEGQAAFAKAKGAIPARADAETSGSGVALDASVASFEDDAIVASLTHGAAVPLDVLRGISEATTRFVVGATDRAGFQAELAAAAG